MKSIFLSLATIIAIFLAGCNQQRAPEGRYQLISASNNGTVFKLDTVTGNTWRILPSGEESLICPPGPMLSLQQLTDLHSELTKNGTTKLSLRDWAMETKRATHLDSYDAAILAQ